jgi:hypothetical protein
MKKLIAVALLMALGMGGSFMAGKGMAPAQAAEEGKVLRHVVMFKFSEKATPAKIAEIEQAFIALATQIKEIKAFEWGTNVSPEKHDQGYTHCFLLSFDSAADRDAYLVHPAHKAFGQSLGDALGGVHVLDYWAKP